jgi:hypothetical protein
MVESQDHEKGQIVFTARNRQNAFAKRRREVREAQQADVPPAEPTAVPYDTRNAESADVVDAPDVSTFATGGVVDPPEPMSLDFPPTDEQMQRADEVLRVDPEPLPEISPIPVELAPIISAETRAKVDAVLNHAIESVEPQTAAEVTDAPKRGRGRPRPQETIDRDNAVHRLLTNADPVEGVSKEALAISLDEKEQQVYSSLRQLSKEGRAETRYVKGHGYRWFAVSPAETA